MRDDSFFRLFNLHNDTVYTLCVIHNFTVKFFIILQKSYAQQPHVSIQFANRLFPSYTSFALSNSDFLYNRDSWDVTHLRNDPFKSDARGTSRMLTAKIYGGSTVESRRLRRVLNSAEQGGRESLFLLLRGRGGRRTRRGMVTCFPALFGNCAAEPKREYFTLGRRSGDVTGANPPRGANFPRFIPILFPSGSRSLSRGTTRVDPRRDLGESLTLIPPRCISRNARVHTALPCLFPRKSSSSTRGKLRDI